MSNGLPLIEHYISYRAWPLWNKFFGSDGVSVTSSKRAFVAALLQGFLTRWAVERALHYIGHRAWLATYGQNWTPHGRWKWFWKYMNFQSPVSFKSYAKALATAAFVVSVMANQYAGVLAVSLYWLVILNRRHLANLYVWAVLYKAWERFGMGRSATVSIVGAIAVNFVSRAMMGWDTD